MTSKNLKKYSKPSKNTTFLWLIKKYRSSKVVILPEQNYTNIYSIKYNNFMSAHTSLSLLFFIMELIKLKNFKKINTLENYTDYNSINKLLNYYSFTNINLWNYNLNDISKKYINLNNNNLIILCRPRKQLFVTIFSNKPIFIFTGGQMRLIINENRKSSKKMYKVAISLIKLSAILTLNNQTLNNCVLKLINTGNLKTKILQEFYKNKNRNKLNYVILKFKLILNSQKFETRRAIKKYIKKRFKLK